MADLQLTRGNSLNSNYMIFTFFLLQNLWWAGIKKGGRTNKLNWGEENWTEIWFHSVIENNYVETTLATTFLSIPKLFLSNLLKFPEAPEDFKLDAQSNKHRILQQRRFTIYLPRKTSALQICTNTNTRQRQIQNGYMKQKLVPKTECSCEICFFVGWGRF